jgi:alkylation response protein AidB-like acyl-CoA dehydrogenase
MDFELTEKQKSFRSTIRSLAEEGLRRYTQGLDRLVDHSEEIIKWLSELKVMGIAVPEEYGGSGLDHVSDALALMEVARLCGTIGAMMTAHSLYCSTVMSYGSHEQKMKYLKPCASGEELGCCALSEADSGSDITGLSITSIKHDHEWVIDGEKQFVTNGNISSYCVTAAVGLNEEGKKTISFFVIDLKSLRGIRRGRVTDQKDISPFGASELVFENVKVSEAAHLSKRDDGFGRMLSPLDTARVGIASLAVGIGRAILEESLTYAKAKEQFGKPIASLQAVQWKLADMATELDAAELMTLKAAWLNDNRKPFQKEAAMAKMYASDVTMRAATEGAQILGGHGYGNRHAVDRFMREAKICQIYAGTNESMRLLVAENLVKGK